MDERSVGGIGTSAGVWALNRLGLLGHLKIEASYCVWVASSLNTPGCRSKSSATDSTAVHFCVQKYAATSISPEGSTPGAMNQPIYAWARSCATATDQRPTYGARLVHHPLRFVTQFMSNRQGRWSQCPVGEHEHIVHWSWRRWLLAFRSQSA